MANAKFSVRRVLSLIAILLAVSLSTLAAVNYWKTRPLPFDRTVWNAEPEDLDDFRRHRMADWLLKQRRLLGMTRAEIVSMLGGPTETSHFRRTILFTFLGTRGVGSRSTLSGC